MSSKRSKNKQHHGAPASVTAPAQAPVQEDSQSSPVMLVVAVLGAAIFMAFYYHSLALGQMGQLVNGMAMLDHRPFGYGADEVNALRSAMDGDALGQLSWVHKTAGTLFTIFTAAATALSIGMYAPRTRWRKPLYLLPLLFFVVAIAQNIVVDQLLGRPSNALLGLSSALTSLSWLLLVACVVAIVWILVSAFVTEFLRRWRDPSLQEPKGR